MSTMKKVTTREAQHHLSRVLSMVEAGEDVLITRRGKSVAKLTWYRPDLEQRVTEMPNFASLRQQLGSDVVKGENEVLLQRNDAG